MRNVPQEYVQLSAYLREQRGRLSMRQSTIAARAEVTPSYVSQVLNGKIKPGDGFLEKLEGILELPVGSLFARLGRPKMDFVQSFLTESSAGITLESATDEERQKLTQYLSYLRLQERLKALSDMKG